MVETKETKERVEIERVEHNLERVEYNPQKHIRYDEAVKLTGLGEELERVMNHNGTRIYSSGDTRFIDRLDLGRAFHEYKKNLNGNSGVIKFERYFTHEGEDPFTSVGEYENRNVKITDIDDKAIFEMGDVYIPKSWNENSARVAARYYFFKPEEKEWREKIKAVTGREYEHSPKHLFSRISRFFSDWGKKLGYFRTEEEAKAFEDELNFLQINQMAAFNSPVNFNAGLFEMYGIPGTKSIRYARDPETGQVSRLEEGCYTRPQTHACFIKGPEDELESLLEQVKIEGSIFADGSGVGHDLSGIRAKGEKISSGGRASGPISFFGGYDYWGDVIESGGKTRRAARMTTMRYWHPDIMEFIRAKVREDHKALTLMKAGYEPGADGEAYKTVKFQSTNLSVRLDDHFFGQLEKGGNIKLRYVKSGEIAGEISTEQMLKEIAFGSWRIGDPAVQYESKIQEMHTAKNSGMQNSSNPCSEYMFLDDTACNLNSLNLLKFADKNGNFDTRAFKCATRIMTIAADIANDAASYPNESIARISPEFRTIGVGYANLGALLMRKGIPYDSGEGRAVAAAITAVMHGEAYKTSAELAQGLGTFVHYELNREPMLEVMRKHRAAVDEIGKWKDVYGEMDISGVKGLEELINEARELHDEAIALGEKYGYRNAQATVLAPTGTIARLMGCDTTGVEPGDALVIHKKLSGGGTLTLANEEVSNALNNLKYKENEVKDITNYVREKGYVVGAPHLSPQQYAVFDTAFAPPGGRTIDFRGHVKMLGATQPFISGAISKTNNLPEEATVKDIYDGYLLGHKLGLKAISVFRYNSKPVSVLSFGDQGSMRELKRGEKRELPAQRNVFETEVKIVGTPLHILVSEYEDGTPGQITFLSYKAGSTLKALLENEGIMASKSLKRGVNLDDIIDSWIGQKFDPQGLVLGDPYISIAHSPLDYAAKWLKLHYLGDLDVVDESKKDKVKLNDLRGSQNGAFETYKMQKVDDWDFKQVIVHPKLGGFVNVNVNVNVNENQNTENKKQNSGNSNFNKNVRGVACNECGNIMRQTAPNCFECDNCYDKRGGCGL